MKQASERPGHLVRWRQGCALASAVLAWLSLWSWAAGVNYLLAFLPGQKPMSPCAALGLLLLNATILFGGWGGSSRIMLRWKIGAGVLVAIMGGLGCAGHWFGWRAPLAEWLAESSDRLGDVAAARMSPWTGISLLLAAVASGLQAFSRVRAEARLRLALTLGIVVSLTGAAGLLAGLAENPAIPMALWTAVALIFLGSALAAESVRLLKSLASSAASRAIADRPPRAIANKLSVVVAAMLMLLTGTSTALYLRDQQQRDRESARQLLEAVANLKLSQISNWRQERLNDARFFSQAEFVARDVLQFLERSDAGQNRTRMLRWLDLLRSGERYAVVALFDTNGQPRLATGRTATNSLSIASALLASAGKNQVVMSDLYRGEDDQLRLDVIFSISPLFGITNLPSRTTNAPPLAFMLLRVDPRQFLFPHLHNWPTPSRTAETALFRREAEEVVFLSALRHHTNSALQLRFPIAGTNSLPAAQAARGRLHRLHGLDYRQVPVLAEVRAVPDSDWFLLAKIDRDEIYAPLREKAGMMLALTVVLTLASGLLVGLVAKRREVKLSHGELNAERQRLALARRVEHLMKHANDAILLADEQDRIVEANERMLQTYGYTLAELQGMRLLELRSAEAEAQFAGHQQQLLASGQATFETLHRRKDGSVFPVEVSASVIEIENRYHKVEILRDLTERKGYEREIERLNRLYSTLSEVNQTIVRVKSRAQLFQEACRIAVQHGGFKLAWIGWLDSETGQVLPLARAGDDEGYLLNIKVYADQRPEGQGLVGQCLRTGQASISNDVSQDPRTSPWREIALAHGLRGAIALPIRLGGNICGAFTVYADEPDVFQNREIALLEEMALDISYALDQLQRQEEHAEAERALHESEELYRTLVGASPNAVTVTDLDGRTVFASAKARQMFGEPADADPTGRSVLDWVAPEEQERARQNVGQLPPEGQFLETEYIMVRKDGSRFHAEATVGVLRASDGSPKGKIILTRDITERKQAEQELLRSESALREAQRVARLGNWESNDLTGQVHWSAEMYRLYGRDPALGPANFQEVAESFTPESWSRLSAAKERAMRLNTSYECDAEVVLPDGSRRWVTSRGEPVCDTRGTIIGLRGTTQDITERKQAEAALQKNQEQLQRLFQASPLPTALFATSDGRIMEVNDRFLALFEWEREAVLGHTGSELDLWCELRERDALLARLKAERTVRDLEVHLRSRRGREYTMLVSAQVIDVSANPVAVIQANDVTERQRAEIALRESESRLNQAQRMAHIGSWESDPRTRELKWSDEVFRIFELEPTAANTSYEAFQNRVHPADREKVRQAFDEALRLRQPYEIVHRLLMPDGRVKFVHEQCETYYDAEGNPIRSIGTVQDVTARMEAETALRESEALFHSLVENVPQHVFRKDVEGRFTFGNGPFCEGMQRSLADILGRTDRDFFPVEVADKYRQDDRRVLQTGERFEGEEVFHQADGRTVFVHVLKTPLRDAEGRIIGLQGISWDISERKRAEATREALLTLETRLSEVRTPRDAANVIFSAADELWDWDCGTLDLYAAAEDRVTSVMNLDVMNGQRREVPSVRNSGEPSVRMRRILEQGSELILRKPPFTPIPDSLTFGDETRLSASVMYVPIRWRHQPVGLLSVQSYTTNAFTPEDLRTLQGLADHCGGALERLQAEAALLESEARLKLALKASRMGVWEWDLRNDEVFWSPECIEIIGMKSREGPLAFEAFLNMIHPEDRDRVLAAAETAIANRTEFNAEFRLMRSDGSLCWLADNGRASYDADDNPLRLVGTVQNITSRKLAEEQVRKLSRAVEQSPTLVVITDPNGRIEYVNPKFTEVTGYSLEEVRGKNPRILKSGVTSPEEYRKLWQQIKAGGEWRGEFHNKKKSGELYWESASISPLFNDAGNITHFLAVKEEITHRKILEAQLRQAQKMEAVGQLAGGVAHDFNNILAAILMNLGLLRETPHLDPFLAESLSDLESEAKRAANLTRQLLMFSRRSVMQVQAVDVNEVVENLLKMLRRLIGEQITLEWQGSSQLPRVPGDAGLIEQIIMNLVVNARDALPRGGRITIATEPTKLDEAQARTNSDARPGEFVCLSVADNGCGMEESVLKRIFEPFYTTKEAGKGTGLGLATVYGIAKQHQGWVTVQSEIGQGSVFCVFLPATQDANGSTKPARSIPILPRGTETILLVEDEASVRKTVAGFLRLCGYQVIEAPNGLEALSFWALHWKRIDLLFTDMVMPRGLNGLQLAQKLRAMKPGLKVVLSSGYSDELVQQHDLAGMGIVFVPKPCPAETLAGTIRHCLDQRSN